MGDQQIFLASMENYKQSFCLADIDPNIEFITHFSAINPIYQHPSALMPLPLDNQYLPEPSETFPAGSAIHQDTSPLIHIHHSQRKRKAMEISSSAHSSPQVSDNETRTQNSTVERGRKVKRGEKKEAKSAEVVHVRAKRGQATDSHSLAERVRREKINERLRCLQDIVPGCYKTMGMAVMLDEIINYVQSLQNQVEFLSMKLTAASTFYDFNSEADALETMQLMQKAKAFEASKIQNGISPGLSSAQFAPLSCNFEYCPQFPHNK